MFHVALFLVAEIIWIGGLSVWLVMERRSPQATLAWIFALIWLPYVGVAVYLLVGPRRLVRKRRRYARARSTVAQTCPTTTPAQTLDSEFEPFARLVTQLQGTPPAQAERLEWFSVGDDCFDSIEAAISQAQHHVHLEYYIWRDDQTGVRFRNLLCEKSRQGVQVRLLLDTLGSATLRRRFLRPLVEAGVEIGWFNPISFSRFRPGLINFRTHRKIVVCDGQIGFTGGLNICDEQSVLAYGKQAWRDTHLRVEGRPVHGLQRLFFENWFFATGNSLGGPAYFPVHGSGETNVLLSHLQSGRPWTQIVASGPDCDAYAIHKFYFAAITAAQSRVLVSTPYFVPDEPILAALTAAALRGVDVRILVPKRSDHRLVTAAARSYFDDLVRAGVMIYEFGPNMLHAKTLVADNVAVIGSANMDNRSFRLNFEAIAAIYDASIADSLATLFATDQRYAEHYSQRRLRHTSFRERLTQSTARLLSPLL